jgi:AcrR family transcriptional regulator
MEPRSIILEHRSNHVKMDGVAVTTGRSARRTDALSQERIIAAAIEILDDEGEGALTFRALARRLSTGAGAIYWHVANKDELLAATTSAVIARVMRAVPRHDDPRDGIRGIALGLFDAIDDHPWIGSELSRQPLQLANTVIFEEIGSKLQALDVAAGSLFDAASALANYIWGAASQNAANARNAPRDMDRATALALAAERWAALDPAEYPFVHQVLAQLPEHDDREQFLAGIDFILAGIAGR